MNRQQWTWVKKEYKVLPRQKLVAQNPWCWKPSWNHESTTSVRPFTPDKKAITTHRCWHSRRIFHRHICTCTCTCFSHRISFYSLRVFLRIVVFLWTCWVCIASGSFERDLFGVKMISQTRPRNTKSHREKKIALAWFIRSISSLFSARADKTRTSAKFSLNKIRQNIIFWWKNNNGKSQITNSPINFYFFSWILHFIIISRFQLLSLRWKQNNSWKLSTRS